MSDIEESGQGLTLVHLSAQLEPFLTLNTSPKRLRPPPAPPSTLPKHPLTTPCPTKSAYFELTGGRVYAPEIGENDRTSADEPDILLRQARGRADRQPTLTLNPEP